STAGGSAQGLSSAGRRRGWPTTTSSSTAGRRPSHSLPQPTPRQRRAEVRAGTLSTVGAAELLGYEDLGSLPESTGTDKLVLKRGNLFAVTGRVGDIWPPGARDQGAYFEDTRFLSKLRLTVAGGPPVVLSSQSTSEYRSQIDLTVTSLSFGGVFADPVNFLHLRREQLADEQLVERLTLTNFLVHDIDYWVEYEFEIGRAHG